MVFIDMVMMIMTMIAEPTVRAKRVRSKAPYI